MVTASYAQRLLLAAVARERQAAGLRELAGKLETLEQEAEQVLLELGNGKVAEPRPAPSTHAPPAPAAASGDDQDRIEARRARAREYARRKRAQQRDGGQQPARRPGRPGRRPEAPGSDGAAEAMSAASEPPPAVLAPPSDRPEVVRLEPARVAVTGGWSWLAPLFEPPEIPRHRGGNREHEPLAGTPRDWDSDDVLDDLPGDQSASDADEAPEHRGEPEAHPEPAAAAASGAEQVPRRGTFEPVGPKAVPVPACFAGKAHGRDAYHRALLRSTAPPPSVRAPD